jgi:hypothetical protein
MAALEIVVDVRDNQTMSQYNTPKNGKIKFTNAIPKKNDPSDEASVLLITMKKNAPWPFCKSDGSPKEQPISVPPSETRAAFVCESFAGNEVVYTAQIGSAAEEDPIIIFEKPKANLEFAAAVAAGVVVGAIATVLVLRLRDRKASPKSDVIQRGP